MPPNEPPPGAPDDEQLVRRTVSGDPSAYRILYERYAPRVLATALRIVGDREEALDLVQDIFVKVYQDLSLFRFESKFSTWLYRIAVNFSLNRASARDRHAILERKLAREAAQDSDPTGAHLPIAPEVVQQAIATLSPKLRAAVALRYLNDLSYEEIAEILGLTIGTVKSRLHLAHEALRAMLKDLLPE